MDPRAQIHFALRTDANDPVLDTRNRQHVFGSQLSTLDYQLYLPQPTYW